MKRSKATSLIGLTALMFGLFGIFAVQAQAQTTSTTAGNFTVAANQTATVNVNVFCLDYGKDFPAGQPVEPNAPADAKLINALQYAISKGYDTSNPRQVQLALWYLRDNTYHTNSGETTTTAQEIVNNANTAATGTTAPGNATTVQNAILNNQVKFAVTGLKPLTSGEFFGTAILQITNLTSNTLNLTLPFGSTFGAPGQNFQTMIGYATGNSASTGAAQATTTAATTTAATTTAATTAAATTTAATTTAATTTAATTTAATTTAATTAPTTDTTAATTTAAVATPTAQGGAVSVPATGEGGATTGGTDSNSSIALVILLLTAAVAMAATGLLITKKARR